MISLSFLELPWDDSVMHHEQQINKKGGISLSKVQSIIYVAIVFFIQF